MTSQRVVRKSLACTEDLLFGKGTVTQTRNGQDYALTKLTVVMPVDTIAERDALDTSQFLYCTVDGVPYSWVNPAWVLQDPLTPATVTVLRLSSPVAGSRLTTLGYHSVSDGGHAEYVVKTAVEYGGTPDEFGDHTLANGNIAVLQVVGAHNVVQYGADPTGASDSLGAFNAVKDNLASTGGTIYAPGQFILSQTLVIDDHAITVEGDGGGPWKSPSELIGDHLAGPVVHFKSGQPGLHDINIGSSVARASASASVGGLNIGLLYEPEDTAGLLVADGTFKRIYIADQPDSGWVASAGVRRALFEQIYVRDCGGHAGAFTNGGLTGRTNTGNVGIITVLNCSAESCGGNALSIGDPGEATRPFRVLVLNYEGSDCSFDAAIRNSNDQLYIRGDNIQIELSAWRGIQPGGLYSGGIQAGGTNIEIINNRYIDTTACVTVNTADTTTRGVKIDGLIVFVTTIGVDQTYAIVLPAADDAYGVRIWVHTTVAGRGFTDLFSNTGPGLEVYYNAVRTISGDTTYNERLSAGTLACKPRQDTAFLAIAAGTITVTDSFHRVTNEASAATDDLDVILGGAEGDVIVLSAGSNSQTVVVKTATSGANTIQCGATSKTLDTSADRITLEYHLGRWFMVAFADNA